MHVLEVSTLPDLGAKGPFFSFKLCHVLTSAALVLLNFLVADCDLHAPHVPKFFTASEAGLERFDGRQLEEVTRDNDLQSAERFCFFVPGALDCGSGAPACGSPP